MIDLLQTTEAIGALIGVAGVIMGILISGWFRGSREKSVVKVQLIETIQMFFSYRKAYIEAVNTKNLDIRKYALLNQSIKNSADPELQKKDESKQSLLASVIQQEVQGCNSYYEKLCDMEAKLHAYFIQVHNKFGHRKYQKVVNPTLSSYYF